jgi:hypothetical protein
MLATILATDRGAVFQPPMIHLEVVEPIFLPGAFGGRGSLDCQGFF